MSRHYEISVCPFCGAQCTYDGGYEGEGWIFSCEHKPYDSEYGTVEPLTLIVDAPAQVEIAVAAAAPALERQKREKAIEDADRKERERRRWDALTPEQQERERRSAEAMRSILRDTFKPLIEDQIRNSNRNLLFWSGEAVIPKFRG